MNPIQALLRQTIGLNASAIGPASIERAVSLRMLNRALTHEAEYLELLKKSPVEWNALVESIVVTETWFFRDQQAFATLARLILTEWLPAHPAGRARLLSVPCSSGEEPYSMAMTLLDAGIPPERFQIDAVDISARALIAAEQAQYGRNSFRNQDLAFRDRYFQPVKDEYVLNPSVRKLVRFHQGNLLEGGWLKDAGTYDFIFCRNLLIYFDRVNQQKALHKVQRLLAPAGVLFVGPAEMSLASANGFVSANLPLSFACHHGEPLHKVSERPAVAVSKQGRSQRLAPATILPGPARKLPAGLEIGGPARHAGPAPANLDHAQQLADAGRLAEAAEICEAHLREYGVSAPAYYLLGLIRDAAGATSQASEFYRRALYLDPGHYETLVQWASLSQKTGDAARARILQERAGRARRTDSSS